MVLNRRLIEDFIPIREISAQAAREKSIRKGHISTLHLWWARRPLVAARAAVFASLVAAPLTYQKRTCLKKTMIELCRWEAGEETIARARRKILEAQRERLNLPADTPLGEVPLPKVLDMFAGGGAIPLEALRLGCEAYAIELNPVAHIIELCTLVYPQKYGKKLAEEVEKWGNWVIENVRAEIGDLYPGICPHPLTPSPTRGEGEQCVQGKVGEQYDKWEISETLRQRMLEVARNLRREQTTTEAILWQHLKSKKRGYKVRRQQPIGAFVVDFYISQSRLIIEIDGSIHDEQQEQDRERQLLLEKLGLKFLRFSTTQIEHNLSQVLETIDTEVAKLTVRLHSPLTLSETEGLTPSATPLSLDGRGAGGEGVQLELLEACQPKQLNLAKTLTPVAYLWTRTVKCPNPACGASVPLVRQTWLCKKKSKYVALKVIPNYQTKQVEFEVVESTTEKGLGFAPAAGSLRGTSICRHCGTTVKSAYVKEQGQADRIDQQLMAIVCTTPGSQGKTYLSGDEYRHYAPDAAAIELRLNQICQETGLKIPNEPIFSGDTRAFFTHLYGLDNFGKLFTPRQLLALMTFVKWVRLAHEKMMQQGYEEEFGKAISTYLAFCINKVSDLNSSLNRWKPDQEGVVNTFSRQALPMVWDYGETNVFGTKTGAFEWALHFVLEFILRESSEAFTEDRCDVVRGSSASLPFESVSVDAVVTDPPYFDSVPYANLSDFFYVWLKRSISHLYPEHFSGQLTPKKSEAIMEPSRHGGNKTKAAEAYEGMMHQAFCEASRVLRASGVMVVVYAHKTTSGWVSLIDSLRRAGFTITEAWPLDTEGTGRLRAHESAALASSIFLVARKREGSAVGDYAMEVKPQLAEIVQERVKTLMEEGVTGADLVIACIGAGLKAYTQFDRVELPNGDELDAQTFLDEVQKEVLETILTDVLFCDKRGVSAVDKPTQYYILGRYEYGEAMVEFDEANTLARGVGVELDSSGGLTDGKLALVKKTKNQVQLRDYSERGSYEDLGIQKTENLQNPNKPQVTGTAPTLIDILHRLLWLAEKKPQDVANFLALAMPDGNQLRLVAQALAGRTLISNTGQEVTITPRTQEQRAIDTLLASWKRLVEENLFMQSNR